MNASQPPSLVPVASPRDPAPVVAPQSAGGPSLGAQSAPRAPAAKRMNKWGVLTVPFESRSQQEVVSWLDFYDQVSALVEDMTGHPLVISYGTLLGACRGGDFLPHDDDFDVAYVSAAHDRAGVLAELTKLREALRAAGYSIATTRLPTFIVTGQVNGHRHELAFHTIFRDGDEGRLSLNPAIHRGLSEDDVFPLSKVSLRGRDVWSIARPEAMLSALYGQWQTPDPNFQYRYTEPTFRAFAFLNGAIWLDQWKRHVEARCAVREAIDSPPAFVAELSGQIRPRSNVLYLGSGSGAGVDFLRRQGHTVLEVDFIAPEGRPTSYLRLCNLNHAHEIAALTDSLEPYEVVVVDGLLECLAQESFGAFASLLDKATDGDTLVYAETRSVAAEDLTAYDTHLRPVHGPIAGSVDASMIDRLMEGAGLTRLAVSTRDSGEIQSIVTACYAKDWTGLGPLFRKAASAPAVAGGHVEYASALASRGQFEAASRHLKSVYRLFRHRSDVNEILGRSAFEMRRFDEALTYLKIAVNKEPRLSRAFARIVAIHLSQGSLQDAVHVAVSKFRKVDPKLHYPYACDLLDCMLTAGVHSLVPMLADAISVEEPVLGGRLRNKGLMPKPKTD